MKMGQPIPALSIRQPWAELILEGKKKIEIRTWDSSYRGRLYLHTGKVPDGYKLLEYNMEKVFRGGYVGIIELVGIIPFTLDLWEQLREQHLDKGTFRDGFFAWILRNPKRFVNPIPAPGTLGLFYPDPGIVGLLQSTPLLDNPPVGRTEQT